MKILWAEPPGVFRDSVRHLIRELASAEGAQVAILEVATVPEARRTAAAARPDIALVSASLPPNGGLRATRAIARLVPACRIVVMSEQPDPAYLILAVQAGAIGMVARRGSMSELKAALASVRRGEAYVPPSMLEGVLHRAAGKSTATDGPGARLERLTERERQVLAGLALGDGNDRLGRRLGISPNTTRTHVQNVLEKLGVHSRLEAAALARRSGLLEPWVVGESR